MFSDPALFVSIAVGFALAALMWFAGEIPLPATEAEVFVLAVLAGKVVLALSVFVLAAIAPRYVVSRVLGHRVGRNRGRIDADEIDVNSERRSTPDVPGTRD